MIFTVDPKRSASGVRKNPQPNPANKHKPVETASHGSAAPVQTMNLVGLANSQKDMDAGLGPRGFDRKGVRRPPHLRFAFKVQAAANGKTAMPPSVIPESINSAAAASAPSAPRRAASAPKISVGA